jgi:hypothetical protein
MSDETEWDTITEAELPGVIQQKLGAALGQLFELQKLDAPAFTGGGLLDAEGVASAFLYAARGVHQSCETFSDGKLNFRGWRHGWEGSASLSVDDKALWKHLRDQRDRHDHGRGLDLIGVDIELPSGVVAGGHGAIFVLRGDISATDNITRSTKGGKRFAAYPDRKISDVCRDILTLVRRFAADFEREYPALLPAERQA